MEHEETIPPAFRVGDALVTVVSTTTFRPYQSREFIFKVRRASGTTDVYRFDIPFEHTRMHQGQSLAACLLAWAELRDPLWSYREVVQLPNGLP